MPNPKTDKEQKLGARHFRKENKKGFTLVEVMVAVAILSFGLVPIFQGLLLSLDTFGYYSDSLEAQMIDEKIWEAKGELMRSESLKVGETGGRMAGLGKEFDWAMSMELIDSEQNLYRLNLTLSWQAGKRVRHISRAAYALVPFKEEKKIVTP